MSFELISENFQIRISNWPFSLRVSQDLILSTRRASRIAFRVSIQVQHISELGYLNSYPNSWRGSAKASQWTSTEALFWVFSETSFSRISRLEREPKIANFFAELFYSLLLSFTLFILLSTLFTRLRENLRNARGVESRGELAKSADSYHPIRITRLRPPNSPNSKYFRITRFTKFTKLRSQKAPARNCTNQLSSDGARKQICCLREGTEKLFAL